MSNSKDAMKDVKEFLAQCFQSVNGQFDKIKVSLEENKLSVSALTEQVAKVQKSTEVLQQKTEEIEKKTDAIQDKSFLSPASSKNSGSSGVSSSSRSSPLAMLEQNFDKKRKHGGRQPDSALQKWYRKIAGTMQKPSDADIAADSTRWWNAAEEWTSAHNQTFLNNVIKPFIKMNLDARIAAMKSLSENEKVLMRTAIDEYTIKHSLNAFTRKRSRFLHSASADERLASLARQHTREAENAKKFKGSVAFALQDVNAFLAASNELKNKFSSPIPDFDETLISKEKEASVSWLVHALPTEPSDDEDKDAQDGVNDTDSDDDQRGARSFKNAVPPPSKRATVGTIKQQPFKRVNNAALHTIHAINAFFKLKNDPQNKWAKPVRPRKFVRDDYAARPIEITEETKELARPWVDDVDRAVIEWSEYCAQNPRFRDGDGDGDGDEVRQV